MKEKRTDWDFSKHIHTTEIYKCEDKEIRVDYFKRPDSYIGYIKFVNDNSGLSIFGDFGNWIFNRPFVPSNKGSVSDCYWNEKLKIGSCQEYSKYDSEETEKQLKTLINGGLEEYGYDGEELEKSINWLESLLDYVDDELEYSYNLYRGDNPVNMDYELLPFCKKQSYQLEIIYDAFDEMCNRMK